MRDVQRLPDLPTPAPPSRIPSRPPGSGQVRVGPLWGETRFRPAALRKNLVSGLVAILLLMGALAWVRPGRAAGPPGQATGIEFHAFDLLTVDEGWLLLGQQLYWTQTGGRSWRPITPPGLGASLMRAVFFLDTRRGWSILSGAGDSGFESYSLAHTLDGGDSWQVTPLALLQPGDVDALAGAVSLHFIDADTGWLVTQRVTSSNFSRGALFKTSDGGATWTRLTIPIGEPVYFVTRDLGWTAGGAAGDELYRTQDGGRTWQRQTVERGRVGETLVVAQSLRYRLPSFENPREGVLPVVASGDGRAEVEFYVTRDGGDAWSLAASIPVGQELGALVPLAVLDAEHWLAVVPPGGQLWRADERGAGAALDAQASPTLAAGIHHLDMATPSVGWAKHVSGSCASAPVGTRSDRLSGSAAGTPVRCSLEIRLLRTGDGGRTWTALTLPQGLASLALTFAGQGFDSCVPPGLSMMQTWIEHSPYRVWNLYIGGSSRGCNAANRAAITPSFVSQLGRQGWKFIPTWVGPQAPCTDHASRMSDDPATAYAEGIRNADEASDAADDLRLATPGQVGAVIYYDLEWYNTTNTACRDAANAFLLGWAAQLRGRGNLAGVYGGGPALSAFAEQVGGQHLDAVWPAHWIDSFYNSEASVWDVYQLSNDLWSDHQRLRQYTGGHTERWPAEGGIDWNIDSDVIDGLVAVARCDGCLKVYLPLLVK